MSRCRECQQSRHAETLAMMFGGIAFFLVIILTTLGVVLHDLDNYESCHCIGIVVEQADGGVSGKDEGR